MSSKPLLVLLSFGLLCFALKGGPQRASYHASQCQDDLNSGLAKAAITGDKSCVPKSVLKTIKTFGLMHLLTPSGLHLSSALSALYFFPRLRLFACLSLFLGTFFLPGLYSLQRMALFRLVNHKIRNTHVSFCVTLVGSVLVGNYAASPISFSLSMLFWGTILFHKRGKFRLILDLYMAQCLVAIAFGQSISPLAIFAGPLVSGLFTLFFPFGLISGIFPEISGACLWPVAYILKILGHFEFLKVSGFLALAFGVAIAWPSKKWALIMMLVCLGDPVTRADRRYQSSVAPLPSEFEYIGSKKNKATFLDRACEFSSNAAVSCKKRPSNYEGPYL